MKITATAETNEEITTLLRAIKSHMSIEDYDVRLTLDDETGEPSEIGIDVEAGKYISAASAAECLNVSRSAISQLFGSGKILGYKEDGTLFVSSADISKRNM